MDEATPITFAISSVPPPPPFAHNPVALGEHGPSLAQGKAVPRRRMNDGLPMRLRGISLVKLCPFAWIRPNSYKIPTNFVATNVVGTCRICEVPTKFVRNSYECTPGNPRGARATEHSIPLPHLFEGGFRVAAQANFGGHVCLQAG